MLGIGLHLTEAPTLAGNNWWLAARHRLDGVAPLTILSPASGRSMLDGRAVADGAPISRQGGVKYVIGKDGALQQVAANVLAYEHVSGRRRLKFEGAATNFIRNSTMVATVPGSPGTPPTSWTVSESGNSGLARTIVGVGTINGIAYMDIRWAGTVTSTSAISMDPEPSMQIPALTGQTWTHSAYIALIGGAWPTTGSAYIGIVERSPSGSYLGLSNTDIRSIGSTLTRVACSHLLDNGSTAYAQPVIRHEPIVGTAVDFTIRIAAPQMEMTPAASSCIPTSGAAVTRPADVAPLWSGAGQATAWAWRGNVPALIAGQKLIDATGGVYLQAGAGTPTRLAMAGADSGTLSVDNAIPGDIGAAIGWGPRGRILANKGSTAQTTDILPTYSRTAMSIGPMTGLAAGQILYLDEVVAWKLPDRPSAAGCQAQARAWSA